jgi:hypothetical protein
MDLYSAIQSSIQQFISREGLTRGNSEQMPFLPQLRSAQDIGYFQQRYDFDNYNHDHNDHDNDSDEEKDEDTVRSEMDKLTSLGLIKFEIASAKSVNNGISSLKRF